MCEEKITAAVSCVWVLLHAYRVLYWFLHLFLCAFAKAHKFLISLRGIALEKLFQIDKLNLQVFPQTFLTAYKVLSLFV